MPATSTTETTAAAARPTSPPTMRISTFAQEGSVGAEPLADAARPLSSLLDSLTRWPASRAHYKKRCRSNDAARAVRTGRAKGLKACGFGPCANPFRGLRISEPLRVRFATHTRVEPGFLLW